jgi:hypothetical protein
MKVTYVILDDNENVLGYSHTLYDAKGWLLEKYPNAEILMMRGNYFGEGFHKYRMKLVNGKFKKGPA